MQSHTHGISTIFAVNGPFFEAAESFGDYLVQGLKLRRQPSRQRPLE